FSIRRHLMKRTIAVFVIAGALLLAGQTLFAHHSAAMFDNQKVKEISGTIKEFQWKNPHIWIQLNVQNGAGVKEEWSIEGGGPNSLSRQGWRPMTTNSARRLRRSEEHTSELQSRRELVCRLLLEKKKKT